MSKSKVSNTLEETSSSSIFSSVSQEKEEEGTSVAPFIHRNFFTLCKKTTNVTQFTYILWQREVLDSEEFKTTLKISSDFLTNCYVYDLLMLRHCQEDLLEALQMSENPQVFNLLKTHCDNQDQDRDQNNNNNNHIITFQDLMEVENDDNDNSNNNNENNTANNTDNNNDQNPMPRKARLNSMQEAFKSINLDNQPYWFEVEDPVDLFVGREEFLQNIHQHFNETDISSSSKVTISSRIQVICGLPGIGKSESVRKYIKDYGDHYDNVIWINGGGTREKAEESMEKIAEALHIPLNFSQGSLDSRKFLVQKIYRLLCQRKKTLFIFDNFDFDLKMTDTETENSINNDLNQNQNQNKEEKQIGALMTKLKQSEFLPSSLPSSLTPPSIIITSRVIPSDLFNCHVLHGLTSEESKTFILNQLELNPETKNKARIPEYQKKKNELDAATLARELGGLPLALKHATSFIKAQNSFHYLVGREPYTIQTFLQELSWNSQRILEYNNFMSKWNCFFSEIYPEGFPEEKVSPGQLLNFLIFLNPDDSCSNNTNNNISGAGNVNGKENCFSFGIGIPSDLFFQYIHQHFTDCTSGEIAKALGILSTHLVITFQNKVILMNPFIQTLVRERLVLRREIIPVLNQMVQTWIKFLPKQQIQDYTTVKYIPGNWKKRLISLSKFLDKYEDISGGKWPEFLKAVVGKGCDDLQSTETGTGAYEEILRNFFGKNL